eukprot:Gregarina_sp_Pseudo_9__4590@NODE_476_length_2748_cov_3140_672204_g450_i0_p2_GENE_NODE_476_length_2748_cov_3140_672204_g450_i0NODE_476_length_2748_cov_3140_672204_g450_i0_p2_ORF_typecomplete_len207_score43_50GST_N/PF02798_20/7_9e14GST_N_3/PF13417_6/2_4e07GST_C_3/PF14497_6/0_00039GST_C/PF00043_25/0_0022GST_N_4/PF17172_4/0_0082GST_C_2/PF13410_6/1e04GST_C_2/PF13410_6/0_23_NODE_476_length_2748_cov_3140_672204_g450_i019962616
MTRPTLTYFDSQGRGEPIRLAFFAGGIDFEDKRVSWEEFMKEVKPTSPNGQLPMLELEGKKYVESLAILQYVCALSGNAPKTPEETLVCQMIMDRLEQAYAYIVPIAMAQSDEEKAKLRAVAIPKVKEILSSADGMVKAHQGVSGHILKGRNFSAPDLNIFCAMSTFEKRMLGLDLGDLPKEYPNLWAIKEAVWADNQRIREYYTK